MNRKTIQVLLLVLMALTLGGCNLADRITSSALEDIDPGSVVYFDNFSNPESGWQVWTSDSAEIY